MKQNAKRIVTLADQLSLLRPDDRIFIIRRTGPHEAEAAASGTVGQVWSSPCMEMCRECPVEQLALDLDDWPELWPEETAPVLLITIRSQKEGAQ